MESGTIKFIILLESIIPRQAAMGLTRGHGRRCPRAALRPDASQPLAARIPWWWVLGKLPESSAQTAGLLMLDQHCVMQIQFDWNNTRALFWIFHLRGKSPDLNRDIDKIIFC